jgi:hypothetical protein
MLAAVDTGKLFELVWAAALAGVVVAVLFATLLVASTRATDLRAEGRHGAATAAYVASIVLALACLGCIVFGLTVIISKD